METIEELKKQLAETQAKYDELAAAKEKSDLELLVWKPQRVEVVQPADNRKPQDFASAKPLAKQFKLSELAGMDQGELARVAEGHLREQLEGIRPLLSPAKFTALSGGHYTKSLLTAISGPNQHARRNGLQKLEQVVFNTADKGFRPLVDVEELRAAIG